MKKILIILVGVLIISGIGTSAASFYNDNLNIDWKLNNVINALNDDVLDQSQPDMDWFGPIGPFPLAGGANYIIAQTFKPTKPT